MDRMPPDTEVIACPACKHVVRVPHDWLGQIVQCPECKAAFRAPVRDGGQLTEPELLTRPEAAPIARRRIDPLLLLPAFGLMFLGLASVAVNVVQLVRFLNDPDAARQNVLAQMEQWRKGGFGPDGPDDRAEQRAHDERRAAEFAPTIRVLVGVFAVVGVVQFCGGLAMATRRSRRLAAAACVLAGLNVAHGCCVPGAVVGIWGLLMLRSLDDRDV